MGKIEPARACQETWETTCQCQRRQRAFDLTICDFLWLDCYAPMVLQTVPQWCLNSDLFPRNAVQDNIYMWSLWVSRLRLGNEAFRSAHRYLVIHNSDLHYYMPFSQSLSAAEILYTTVVEGLKCKVWCSHCFTAQLIPVNDRGSIWPDHLRSGESWWYMFNFLVHSAQAVITWNVKHLEGTCKTWQNHGKTSSSASMSSTGTHLDAFAIESWHQLGLDHDFGVLAALGASGPFWGLFTFQRFWRVEHHEVLPWPLLVDCSFFCV